jgi:hypothetical protein
LVQPLVAAVTRTPYADRPEVIAEHCTCHHVWSQKEDGTIQQHELISRDRACKLHGDNAESAPF